MTALKSQSPQIVAAARLAFINWALSLQLWLYCKDPELAVGYMVIDALTAAAYFRMSRRRWFPVPLCFLHGVLAIFHLTTLLGAENMFWEKFVLNRAFDFELAYILGCALFRIAVTMRVSPAKRA